jgi:hypothetical protein
MSCQKLSPRISRNFRRISGDFRRSRSRRQRRNGPARPDSASDSAGFRVPAFHRSVILAFWHMPECARMRQNQPMCCSAAGRILAFWPKSRIDEAVLCTCYSIYTFSPAPTSDRRLPSHQLPVFSTHSPRTSTSQLSSRCAPDSSPTSSPVSTSHL